VGSLVDYSRKIIPPSAKRKRGKKPLYMYRAPENGKRKLRQHEILVTVTPAHGLNRSRCYTKPLIYIRNIQKAKAEKKFWYQYIFFPAAENRGN
jgi:hypothetical protein